MWRKLLEILADPADGLPLRLADDPGTDPVMHGELVSPSGAKFPIVRGVPRFVDDNNYTGSFGLQWNRFAKVQLDSVTHTDRSRRRFDAEVGWANENLGAVGRRCWLRQWPVRRNSCHIWRRRDSR